MKRLYTKDIFTVLLISITIVCLTYLFNKNNHHITEFYTINKSTLVNDSIKNSDSELNLKSERIIHHKQLSRINYFIENNLLDSLIVTLDGSMSIEQHYIDYFMLNAIQNNNIAIAKELQKRFSFSNNISKKLSEGSEHHIEKYINLETFNFIVNEKYYRFNSTQDSIFSFIYSINYKKRDLINHWLENGCAKYIEETILLYCSEAGNVYGSPLSAAINICDTILIKQLINDGLEIKPEHFHQANSYCIEFLYKILASKKKYSNYKIFSETLHWRAFVGDIKSIEKLLSLGANINFPDSNNRTPIFYTIEQIWGGVSDPTIEKYNVLKFLIKKGANVNHQDKDGLTPLMLTTQSFWNYGYNIKINFARYLIDNGAFVDIKDRKGMTFWDHIIKNENITFIDFFSKDLKTPNEIREQLKEFSKSISIEKREHWEERLFHIPDYD